MRFATDYLDEYIDLVDSKYNGNMHHPDLIAELDSESVQFSTEVDQSLDPFSEEYASQQISLYEEISGRKLDQTQWERTELDPISLGVANNPFGIEDVHQMASKLYPIASLLYLSKLPPNAKVLDLGAGRGMSSEIFEYCGCNVHSIDIDSSFNELIEMRNSHKGLNVKRSNINFDNINELEDRQFNAAFFSRCLHHAVRPWVVIKHVREKLVPGGIIGFVGEPINTIWWKDWGIRLDRESVYVARKRGWFESGWSAHFIMRCFEVNGFSIKLHGHGIDGSQVGIAIRNA